MKQWACLRSKFRHHADVRKHSACFRAVAVLTQLGFEFGEPLFDTSEYSDSVGVVPMLEDATTVPLPDDDAEL